MDSLPVDEALPRLKEALAARNAAVLVAPPGAGKTTRVPLALLDAPWLGRGKIVMQEPRRLAARAAARRMAATLDEAVGETVGYRVRLDTRVGPRTRIEVVTDGLFLRMLQDDPSLEGIGCVIFDELHERGLETDLSFALVREAQTALREDLRVIAMSATLDPGPVADRLGGASVVESAGRMFPVDTRYLDREATGRIEDGVAATVRRALAEESGSALVFLPGVGEIRRVEERLHGLGGDVDVAPLYGDLSPAEQDRAITPSPAGRRKVVLATSIAETSLTIEGVRIVIDSGQMRVPKFSARSGMTRLETVRVSQASADQRRGRAGRLEPGVCYRLWPEETQRGLLPFTPPEILDADLAPLALELAAWGTSDAASLPWLTPPPASSLATARALLVDLAAIDDSGAIIGSVGTLRDITERVTAEERAKEDAAASLKLDELTGLLSRPVFFDKVEEELKRLKRTRSDVSVIVLSIDCLKEINEYQGRIVGDEIVREITGIVKRALRETDSAGRTAGNEFAICLPDTPAKGAFWVAERIRETVIKQQFFNTKNEMIGCTVSLGVASACFDDQMRAGDLFKAAESRLFIARHTGENKVSVDELVNLH